MLDLFQDPVAYFTDPSREMKDEGYKQQCVVALKEAFRYTLYRSQTGNRKIFLLCTKIQFLKIDELSNFGRNIFFGGGGETFLRNCLRKNISNVMETF